MAKQRIAGVSFEHAHMGDLLREAHGLAGAEIVAVCDEDEKRMAEAIANFAIPRERVYRDIERCLEETRPDLAILCPATARHADVAEEVAAFGVDILLEKPFAASLADADRILAAAAKSGVRLGDQLAAALVSAACHAKRLIDEGAIGEVLEVHFYDGNRGPLYHRADKVVVSEEEVRREKPASWWYRKAAGGGCLLDYLGYGATLGTWFLHGEAPHRSDLGRRSARRGSRSTSTRSPSAATAAGLSKFETRWGTFTDPWTQQPQPKCGFVVVGAEGTISSYDYEDHVGVQTRARSGDPRRSRRHPGGARSASPVEYVLHCLEKGLPFEGPLDPALCRTAQRIVDTAALSARERRTLALLP